MTVDGIRGRHRRPKHRFNRSLATALLITLLIGIPAVATMGRPATYSAAGER